MPTAQRILSKARRTRFDNPPDLESNRNRGFITVDAETMQIVRKMSLVNKVGFVLQKTYFHAKGRFYKLEKFKPKHVGMVSKCLGLERKVDISEYSYSTMKAHQNKILELFNWEKIDANHLISLELYAITLAEKKPLKEDVLFKLVEWCWASNVTIPTYEKLVSIVYSAYKNHEGRLEEKISAALSLNHQTKLLSIFRDEILTDDFSQLCKINLSKQQYDLKRNAVILARFKSWFESCRVAREAAGISRESVAYYSEAIVASTLPQLKRLTNNENQCLLALSFIAHNFFLRTDSSIDAFLKDIRSTNSKSISHEKETKLRARENLEADEAMIIGSMENATNTLRLILNVAKNSTVSLPERNEKVIQLANSCLTGNESELLDSIEGLRGELLNIETKKHRYAYLFECGNSLSRKYSQYLPLWEFNRKSSDKDILNAIDYIIEPTLFDKGKCPTSFMDDNEMKLVFKEDNIPTITKYRVILFLKLEKSIRNKSVTLLYSYRFQNPGSAFISTRKWKKDKHLLCRKSGIDKFFDGEKSLAGLGKSVSELFSKLNDDIECKDNEYVHRHPKGGWRYDLPTADYSQEKFIPKILSGKNEYITLLNILREIDRYSHFTDYFSNRRISGGKFIVSKKLLYATLYSLGTNIGHNGTIKMTENLTDKQLRDTENIYFSIKSLKNVNKCIIEFIHSLNLPMLYVDKDRVIHTSSDGKKLVVNVDSLLANYSFKYYGKESGVNVMNFVDPKQISFNVNILPSSDREAPYMLDGLIESADKLWELYEKGDDDENTLKNLSISIVPTLMAIQKLYLQHCGLRGFYYNHISQNYGNTSCLGMTTKQLKIIKGG